MLGAGRPGTAPVLAILPFEDHRLLAVAEAAGAADCYSLDTPLDRLTAVVLALVCLAHGDRQVS